MLHYHERITRYLITGYRLMQIQPKHDILLCEGTLDEVVAARERYIENGGNDYRTALYFQAHYPNGHPDYPGSWGVWVKHDLLGRW